MVVYYVKQNNDLVTGLHLEIMVLKGVYECQIGKGWVDM